MATIIAATMISHQRNGRNSLSRIVDTAFIGRLSAAGITGALIGFGGTL
jgi:hypothetical protein